MEVLLLDNYDSFTFNLFHYCEDLGANVTVVRNREIDLKEVVKYDKIILSPGPHLPKDAGKLMELIEMYHEKKPILGVCLGLQALVSFFGGTLYNLKSVKHGVQEKCNVLYPGVLLKEVSNTFDVGLYHSWAVQMPLPVCLHLSALTKDETVMAFEHKELPIYGVQFHPESVMTPEGKKILANFLSA